MMKPALKCASCGGPLETGFIPEFGHYDQSRQLQWHEGAVEKGTFLGFDLGPKVNRDGMHPIVAFRCTNCGLLHFYTDIKPARPKKWKKVVD